MRESLQESGSPLLDGELRGVVREYGAVFLKGMAMGTADAVPGVSGGTIALITGIYERLIAAVTALDPSLLGAVPSLGTREGRREFVAELRERDVAFLLALGTGVAAAFVTVSGVADWAFENARAATYAFFFGLIAASAIVLYREVDLSTPGRKAVAVGGFVLAFWISGLTGEGLLPETALTTFLAGTIAVSAMVLPGISGSSFLLLLGQYEYLIGRLHEFVSGLAGLLTGGTMEGVVGPATTVVAFLSGAAVGLFSIAHVIRWALQSYRAATLAFLVSLLAGTLRIPVVEVRETVSAWTAPTLLALLVPALLGAGAVVLLDLYTDDLEY